MKHARKFLAIIIVLSLLLGLPGAPSPASADSQETNLSSDRLIVRFKPGTSWSEMIKVHQQVGCQVEDFIPQLGAQVVTVPDEQKLFKSWAYRFHEQVSYVESDYVAQIIAAPDDPYFDKQWGMIKVQAPEAWNIAKGNADIRIAILDTGIDSSHPDLASKIVSQQNFSSSGTVEDRHGHGTHCAGIAAAITDNEIGVAGLGYDSSLMNVKTLADSGSGYYSWVAQGIIWATDHGANVISMSLGGRSASSTIRDAIDYAWGHGVMVVAAAGNNGNSSPVYPAYYTNCIAVAATDANDNLAPWSTRGDWVDVAAPGVNIYSTYPNNGYKYLSGTSMACPHVAGLAALVFSVASDTNNNAYLNDEVRYRIEATCDNIASNEIAGGRINAYKALPELAPAGQISGTVTDASISASIEGATVTDGTRSATTDSNGNYTIASVPEGTYTLTASAHGYQNASQVITVVASETSIANFSLAPSVNHPPALDSIGDKTIDEGQLLQFTVSASDPDGDTLTYSAANLPEGASFEGQTFSWTPDYGQAGTYELTFTVSDGKLTDSETVTITVNQSLPGQISGTVIDASSSQSISAATVTDGIRSATTDSNGSYTISNLPQGTYILTASADGYQSSTKTVAFYPGETTIADFSLVKESPPTNTMWVQSITFTPSHTGLSIKVKVVNPEPVGGATVNLNLQSNGWNTGTFSGSTNSLGEVTFHTRGISKGEYLATVTTLTHQQYLWDKSKGVTSARYAYGVDTSQISGTVTDASTSAPIEGAAVTDGTRSATTDSNGSYTITSVPEGTYSLTASAYGYQNASQPITVVAGQNSIANFSLDRSINHPPAFDPIGDKSIDEGQLLQFTISATDPDGDTLTYSALNLPQGASFDNQTFSWTPSYEQAATYQVTFNVVDGKGGQDSKTVTITVKDVNRAPALEPVGNKAVNEGHLLQFSIHASDPDGDPLTYSAANLPEGASFEGQTFSWIPNYDQGGIYEVTFKVEDGKGGEDSEQVTITVNDVSLTGEISGIVKDADSGQPISAATVIDGTRSATTDSNGSYTISSVPQGTYSLTASADGYQSSTKTVAVHPGETTIADFSLVKESPNNTMWVQSITFTPSYTGLSIKVKVVNPEPVGGATVNLKLQINGWNTGTFLGSTNPAGEVTFHTRGASKGEYLAIVTSLTHEKYLWDKSKGVTSARYTLE